jgi:hypothetical protein
VDKAHVEHAVSLVEDDRAVVGEADVATLDEILEAARSADDKLVAIFKCLELGPIEAPPTQTTEKIFIPLVKPLSSLSIWIASSRVGTTISTCAFGSWRTLLMRGIRNAAVLPVPVLAIPTTS